MKHTPEWIENQSTGLKRAWSDPEKFTTMRRQSREFINKRIAPLRGRHQSEDTKLAISLANKGRKLSPEHKAASSATWLNGPQNLSPEIEQRRRKGISEARTGCHNYGRAARDRLDHFKALHWIVRDPQGILHEFDNLQSWCRANEWRFQPDSFPNSKTPLWRRAVGGFGNQQRTDGKGQHHWKGWVLVSVIERKELGAPDPLERRLD